MKDSDYNILVNIYRYHSFNAIMLFNRCCSIYTELRPGFKRSIYTELRPGFNRADPVLPNRNPWEVSGLPGLVKIPGEGPGSKRLILWSEWSVHVVICLVDTSNQPC